MSDKLAVDKDWEEAEYRARVITELPEQLAEGDVEWAMRQLNISRATVFRLAKQFRDAARPAHSTSSRSITPRPM